MTTRLEKLLAENDDRSDTRRTRRMSEAVSLQDLKTCKRKTEQAIREYRAFIDTLSEYIEEMEGNLDANGMMEVEFRGWRPADFGSDLRNKLDYVYDEWVRFNRKAEEYADANNLDERDMERLKI